MNKPGMIPDETKDANIEPNHVTLMRRAAKEIERLRDHNNIMAAKLSMFDKCMSLVQTQPERNDYSLSEKAPDIVHQMQREVNSISKV